MSALVFPSLFMDVCLSVSIFSFITDECQSVSSIYHKLKYSYDDRSYEMQLFY